MSVSCEMAQSVGVTTAVYRGCRQQWSVWSELLTLVSHSAWFVVVNAICSSVFWDGGIAAILLSGAGKNCRSETAKSIDRNEENGF